MIALLVAMALSTNPGQPTVPPAGRIISSPNLHLGVRPAIYVAPTEVGVGVTFQLTVNVL